MRRWPRYIPHFLVVVFAVWCAGEASEIMHHPDPSSVVIDEIVAIPHMEQVESLNAGVAGSIVLYESARQRRQP